MSIRPHRLDGDRKIVYYIHIGYMRCGYMWRKKRDEKINAAAGIVAAAISGGLQYYALVGQSGAPWIWDHARDRDAHGVTDAHRSRHPISFDQTDAGGRPD